jgi:hypothetical protein
MLYLETACIDIDVNIRRREFSNGEIMTVDILNDRNKACYNVLRLFLILSEVMTLQNLLEGQ